MNLKDFYYELPEELIAQEPLEERDSSRLLVLNKENGEITHNTFRDIIKYFKKGDCLVLNNTRVIPARLYGIKKETGSKTEFLLLKRLEKDIWEVILRPGKKAQIGARFIFGENELEAEIMDIVEGGNRIVKFYYEGVFEAVLDRLGICPYHLILLKP
jgi:S-adenosylmethionine:tRNA ribosyltransferase-isomerase